MVTPICSTSVLYPINSANRNYKITPLYNYIKVWTQYFNLYQCFVRFTFVLCSCIPFLIALPILFSSFIYIFRSRIISLISSFKNCSHLPLFCVSKIESFSKKYASLGKFYTATSMYSFYFTRSLNFLC